MKPIQQGNNFKVTDIVGNQSDGCELSSPFSFILIVSILLALKLLITVVEMNTKPLISTQPQSSQSFLIE